MLLVLTVELARGVEHILQVAARKLAVMVVFVILCHVEVHRALALVGIAVGQDFLYQLYLLDDVARGVRLYAGGQHVQGAHGVVVAVGVVLRHLHGFQLLQACLLGNLVLAFVGIVLQVPHVGNVAHVAHLVAQVAQVAEEQVEGDGRTRMPQVRVAIYSRAAHVHAHVGSVQRHKGFFPSVEGVVNNQWMFHNAVIYMFRSFLGKDRLFK